MPDDAPSDGGDTVDGGRAAAAASAKVEGMGPHSGWVGSRMAAPPAAAARPAAMDGPVDCAAALVADSVALVEKKVVKPPYHAVDNVVAREKLNIDAGVGISGSHSAAMYAW